MPPIQRDLVSYACILVRALIYYVSHASAIVERWGRMNGTMCGYIGFELSSRCFGDPYGPVYPMLIDNGDNRVNTNSGYIA